jgi:hypothetical protein
MVMAEIKNKVKEIADIAASLPENLQQQCFELLLKHFLASRIQKVSPESEAGGHLDKGGEKPSKPAENTFEETTTVQSDLTTSDLHVKLRRFMEKYNVTLAELNNLFYKEGENILPLYDDLKTIRMSETQTRIALLQSIQNAFKSGEFQSAVDSIRNECRDRKCLDSTNFAANFKNNRSLYDFGKYTKETSVIRLSEDGRKELSQLIKELQK